MHVNGDSDADSAVNLFVFSTLLPCKWSCSEHVYSADLFPVLEKRTCDLRWEVRDSALEFITQLTAVLCGKLNDLYISQLSFISFYLSGIFLSLLSFFSSGNGGYVEALHTSGMFSILLSSLKDVEGYVRASAVGAVGEAVTSSVQQREILNNNMLVRHFRLFCIDKNIPVILVLVIF